MATEIRALIWLSFVLILWMSNRLKDAISCQQLFKMLMQRVIEQTFSMQGQQHFPAGHIFEAAAGLNPVPLFAQFPGNMSPASVPVFMDQGLNKGQVFGGNFDAMIHSGQDFARKFDMSVDNGVFDMIDRIVL